MLLDAQHLGEEVPHGEMASFHFKRDAGALLGKGGMTVGGVRHQAPSGQVPKRPGHRRAGHLQVLGDLAYPRHP